MADVRAINHVIELLSMTNEEFSDTYDVYRYEFNMGYWQQSVGCGTAACLGGTMNLSGAFGRINYSDHVARALGISREVAQDLCLYPGYYNVKDLSEVTKDMVIEKLTLIRDEAMQDAKEHSD